MAGHAKKAVVGKHALADFLSTSDNGAAFLGIEKEILSAIQSQIQTNNLGLQVEFLGLKRLQLPESVSQSVFDRMTFQCKRLAERFQSEGEKAEAQRIRADAERRAAETLADAESKATQIKGTGVRRASNTLELSLPAHSFQLFCMSSQFQRL